MKTLDTEDQRCEKCESQNLDLTLKFGNPKKGQAHAYYRSYCYSCGHVFFLAYPEPTADGEA